MDFSKDGVAVANRLEVRVHASEAAFLVNGKALTTMPIAQGQLDGVPGVYVGAQGEVDVAGFAVQSTAPLLRPGK